MTFKLGDKGRDGTDKPKVRKAEGPLSRMECFMPKIRLHVRVPGAWCLSSCNPIDFVGPLINTSTNERSNTI